LAGALAPEIVLVDHGGDCETWREALHALHRLHPSGKIVALVDHAEVARTFADADEVVSGYISIDSPEGILEEAIGAVLNGRQYLCPCIEESLAAMDASAGASALALSSVVRMACSTAQSSSSQPAKSSSPHSASLARQPETCVWPA